MKSSLLQVLIWLVTCGTVCAQAAAPVDLFAPDRVIDVRITIDKRDWRSLRMQSRSFETALSAARKKGEFDKPFTYFEADVVVDGVAFQRVGLRKKGFIGSLSTTRPSLKIKLNHLDPDASLHGLSNLTLNNNKQDESLVSQFLTYKTFNDAGSPAPRCGFARVTVNDRYLGIYSHVERMRDDFLKRGFGSAKGVLYEGTVVDFFPGWEKAFERKLGSESRGLSRIQELIGVVSEASDAVFEKRVGELVDLDAFYRFWALEGLLGFWDGYTGNKNNFFCYLHPDTNRFHFLPWGADMLFMKYSLVDDDREVPLSVKTTGRLAHRLYQLKSGRDRYAKTMQELLDTHWNEDAIYKELDRLEALLEPHLGRYQRRAVDAMDRLREFVEERRSDILAETKDGMPIWPKKPKPPFVMPSGGSDWEPSIWSAAKDGDVGELKSHIRAGADVNSVSDDDGSHPLALAAMAGRKEAVSYLLEQGAKVNDTDEDGDSALHKAAFFGHVEIAKLLLEAGAEPNAKNQKGSTPLINATIPWSPEIAGIIGWVGTALGIKYDLKEVRANRPKVARLLRKNGAKSPR
jgi:spore coat protein CotH